MADSASGAEGPADLTYSRCFHASPALLWRALTEPAILPRWLGSPDTPMVGCALDLRVGGALRRVWRQGGQETGVFGQVQEVNPPHRLVTTERFDGEDSGGETTVTQDLVEIAPQTTRLTMTIRYQNPLLRDAKGPDMVAGLDAHYATLDRLLPRLVPGRTDFRLVATGERQITVTRSFAAPKASVLRAHTEADLLRRWMGSPDMPLDICEMDARPEGRFRYVWRMQDGGQVALTGRIIAMKGDSITHEEVFDPDWTGGPTTVVTRFDEAGGRTTVTVQITYSASPARDQVLASGMGEGMAGGYALLDALLQGAD